MAFAPLILASVDSFWIMVAIAIGSAVVEWLQKRKQSKGAIPPTPVEPQAPADIPGPPASPADWQEELRKLLEGEGTHKPATPPPIPTVVETAPSHPLPPVAPRPVIDVPPPIHRPTRPVVVISHEPEPEPEMAPAPTFVLADFSESEAAYKRASHLEASTADRLQAVSARTSHPVAVLPPGAARCVHPDVEQIHAWLRDPRTARQVMAASFILGPPRALEER